MFCSKCGQAMPEDAKFCPKCGAAPEAAASQAAAPNAAQENGFAKQVASLNDTPDTTQSFAAEDIAQNKGMAALSYLSFLVLIPIFAAKNSRFARFHANQGLVLLVVELAWGIVTGVLGGILTAISPFLVFVSSILSLANILFFVLMILGIVNAVNGRAKELPIIGKLRFLQY